MTLSRCPIAVVGVSTLFPGSSDVRGFWNDILSGTDRMGPVPPGHWLVEDFYDPDPSAPDKTYVKRGAFLDPVDFDPMAFGIPPAMVRDTDTTQLLALIVAQKVLDDATAGQFASMDRSRVSCILGCTGGQELMGTMAGRLHRPQWVKALREQGLPEDEVQEACDRISATYVPWTEASFPGLLGNVTAGRIANRLDLGGTNCVTDAACASTLSALSMSMSELYLRQSDLVICGGTDTMNDIFMFMCFSKTPALSKTGDCRPFSSNADGTMLGEGLGMVALKRLDDAQRDGDRVYALIQGIGGSSDGKSKSVYAPLSAGQARAIRRAYEHAGYSPETVEMVEAHGTGTIAGDAAEVAGLRMVFDDPGITRRRPWCALASVKAQIGHTKAAAGAAGLAKAVLALHHRILPPSIKVDRPNPALEAEGNPFYLSPRARPWIHGSAHPRRASVSSFGFGGSNFHVTLEEGPVETRPGRFRALDSELVVLSATDAGGLRAACDAMLAEIDGATLAVIARDSVHAPTAGPARLAVVAGSLSELAEKLEAARDHLAGDPGRPLKVPGVALGLGEAPGKVAFLFPGQGSQRLEMGGPAAMHLDAARDVWDRAADTVFDGFAVHEVVFPPPSFDADERARYAARLTATEWAQPALGVASAATLAFLRALGLEPDAVAGHSFGEVTALFAAGVLDEQGLLRVARERGERMAAASELDGAMISVRADPERALAAVPDGCDVVLANHNSPVQTVLSGSTSAIETAAAALEQAGIATVRLEVATAFHSSIVAGAVEPLAGFLQDVPISAPRIPVIGNTLAEPYPDAPEAIRALLAGQLAAPVRWVDVIERLWADGVRCFVEVGPGTVLTRLVGRVLGKDRAHLALATEASGDPELATLWHTIGALWVAGVPVDLAHGWDGYRPLPDPRLQKPARLAIPLSGTNYDKAYPPAGGAAALPRPNPPAPPAQPAVETPRKNMSAPPDPLPPGGGAPPGAYGPPAVALPAAPAHPAATTAVGELQRVTAQAHIAYQQAVAQAHVAFLQTVQASIAALTGAGAASFTAPALTAPAPMWAPAPPPAWPAPPVWAAPAPVAAPAPPAPAPAWTPPPPAPAPVAAAAPPPPPAPAPAAAAPPTPAMPTDPAALLLAVVAEKTGYPADMLELGMRLEADLGIDSIKRVEILSAMREQAPQLPDVDPQSLGALETLGEIVAALDGGAPVNPPEVRADELGRYAVRWVSAPALGLSLPGLATAPRIHVVPARNDVAVALVDQLVSLGLPAELADEVPADARAVVHLDGLGAASSASDVDAVLRGAFTLARRLAPGFTERGGLLVTVHDPGPEVVRAALTGLAGLVKTAALEWPEAHCKSVALTRGDRTAAALAEAIVEELLRGGPEVEVALADERRTPRAVGSTVVRDGPPRLGSSDVVVASGGARGVTAACLIALARETGARMVLIGRSPLIDESEATRGLEAGELKRALLDEARGRGQALRPADLGALAASIERSREVRDTLATLEAAGSPARYAVASVRDAAAVAAALSEVRTAWGPITAVIHGAGVLADRLLVDKRDEDLDAVLGTKVEGLRALLAATASDPLRVLCAFGSVAGRCGNRGQSDYALANEALSSMVAAEAAHREGLVGKTMAWGPWAGGMVTPALAAHFAAAGVPLISLEAGARMLVDELCYAAPSPNEVVLGGEPRPEGLDMARPPELRVAVRADTTAWPMLLDHQVRGRPVVPVALVLEWMARAAQALRPDLHLVALQGVQVLRGIRLEAADAAAWLEVQVRQLENGRGAVVAVELLEAGRPTPPLYRATAMMATRPEVPAHEVALDLPAWETVIYDGDVLFHGPAFQVIDHVDGATDQALQATLAGGADRDWGADAWVTDPALVDGALQCAVLFAKRMLGGGASLPTAIGAVRLAAVGLCTGPIKAVVRASDVTATRTTTDVRLIDGDGAVIVDLRGVQTHLLPPSEPAVAGVAG